MCEGRRKKIMTGEGPFEVKGEQLVKRNQKHQKLRSQLLHTLCYHSTDMKGKNQNEKQLLGEKIYM